MDSRKIEQITQMLEEGVQSVFESDAYKDYLICVSKFHRYSYRNIMLIKAQCPHASEVAGFVKWQNDFGRQVKKGEKGIWILAPSTYKKTVDVIKKDDKGQPILNDENKVEAEKKEIIVPTFSPVAVFDISQTTGKELPNVVKQIIEDDGAQWQFFLSAIVKQSLFQINYEMMEGSKKGYCDYSKQKIGIKEGMGQGQTCKTAIHEIAHSRLHGIDTAAAPITDRHCREVQAESVAFVVSNYFGLDTSDYSFGYIATWSKGKELKELKHSLELIQKESSDLINQIESAMKKDVNLEVPRDAEINI